MRQLKISVSITNRESGSLERYLQEIGREEMISTDEEVELARRIHKGDREALERLIRSNLRFVVSVAKQYQGQGLGLVDLINEGNLGLITAAQKFDETRGFKFISYAVWWIRQCILQAIAEKGRIVRMPLNQVGWVNKINRTVNKFLQEQERLPNLKELADLLNLPEDKIEDAMKAPKGQVSGDAPIVDGEDGKLFDTIPNTDSPNVDDELVNESLKEEIDLALGTLNEREQLVVKAFFGIGQKEMTLEEIGSKYGLTRERVRQIKEKAIKRLRSNAVTSMLNTYLGR